MYEMLPFFTKIYESYYVFYEILYLLYEHLRNFTKIYDLLTTLYEILLKTTKKYDLFNENLRKFTNISPHSYPQMWGSMIVYCIIYKGAG